MGDAPNGTLHVAPQENLSSTQMMELQKQVLARQVRTGANWFYWITGLSLINSIITLAGGEWRFVVGLGITQMVDAIANEAKIGVVFPFILDVLASGSFVIFGLLAGKRKNWAFLTGMIFYALDGLLLALFKAYLGFAFHLYVLYCLYKGMKANEQLEALEHGILPA